MAPEQVAARAADMYRRAAQQGNFEAELKLGDYHYYGQVVRVRVRCYHYYRQVRRGLAAPLRCPLSSSEWNFLGRAWEGC